MSFPAAAADPSVFGLTDPAAGGESSAPAAGTVGDVPVDQAVADDAPGNDEAELGPDTEPPATDDVRDANSMQSNTDLTVPAGDESAPPAPAPPAPVKLLSSVIEAARAAAVEEAGRSDLVGEYLGAVAEDDVAVAAAFAAADRGYRGWYWSVTLALVEPEHQTISEVVLLPGEQALLAPPWVPWDRRIRAGDVGAGDLLPAAPDDVRLVPGYVDSDDPAIKEVQYEFGFGRPRVLSREGRDDAAQRWHDGPFGPDDAVAQAAPANCLTCGFFTPLAGLLGVTLGACANEFSPADGRVVDAEYGCGAHSQTVIDAPMISASTDTVVDELTLEVHRRPVRTIAVAEVVEVVEVELEAVLDSVPDAEPAAAEPEDLLQDAEPDDAVDHQVSDVAWAADQPDTTH